MSAVLFILCVFAAIGFVTIVGKVNHWMNHP